MKASYEELEQLKINLGEAASPLLVDPINKAINAIEAGQEKDALIQEYEADNKRLSDRIAELKKYKARLEALIRYSNDGETFLSVSKNALYIYCEYGSIETVGTGNSENEAIDAAMEAEK